MVKNIIFVLAITIVAAGCKGPLSAPSASRNNPEVHKAVVKEVLNAGGYTYLNVTEKRKDTWLAVPGMKAAKGDKLSYSGGMEMNDFHSKELDRTFPSILFLEGVVMESGIAANSGLNAPSTGSAIKIEKVNITLEPVEGCISIANLLETKLELSGKSVKIKGIVTKFNPEIMGKNWIHIQDGSEFKGTFDLTITTAAQVMVGDTATFEGKITLKKDFGYGYFYEVIMEDGKRL
jgi:predicted small lipoprotein YifL